MQQLGYFSFHIELFEMVTGFLYCFYIDCFPIQSYAFKMYDHHILTSERKKEHEGFLFVFLVRDLISSIIAQAS